MTIAKAPQDGDSPITYNQIFEDNADLINSSSSYLKSCVHVESDVISVSTKFSSTEDMIVKFDTIPNNETRGFYSSFLIPNSNSVPVINPQDYDHTSPTVSVVLARAYSEYVGPINLKSGAWVGGSHLHNGYKTSETIAFTAFADGKKVSVGGTVRCSTCMIHIDNRIYNPVNLPSIVEMMVERQQFSVDTNTLGVTVSIACKDTVSVGKYYGLQTDKASYFNELYYSNSQFATLQTYASGVNTGDRATYQNVDMCAVLSTDKSLCQVMWLDRDFELGTLSQTSTSDNTFFTSGDKAYAYLINWKDYAPATSFGWRGSYSWGRDVQGSGGNGFYAVAVNTPSRKMVCCAVGAGNKVFYASPEGDYGKILLENAGSNQNGLASWDNVMSQSGSNQFSWVNGASCVYSLVESL